MAQTRNRLRLCGYIFGDLNPGHTAYLSQRRWRCFPHSVELVAFHCFVQLFEMSPDDDDDRMGIVEIEFRPCLVQFSMKQPRVRNEPAAGGQMESDAKPGSHHFGIETAISDEGGCALEFGLHKMSGVEVTCPCVALGAGQGQEWTSRIFRAAP
jgi:hypothetical protein